MSRSGGKQQPGRPASGALDHSASVRPALSTSASVRPALSASVRPVLSASVGPALSASVRPALSASALSASVRPALSASVSVRPALSASAHPALSAFVGPALSASVGPALSASVDPALPVSVVPALSASVRPAQSASVGPALSASVRPAQSASVRSAQSASVGPVLSASVLPAQSASVAPVRSASVRPAQSASVGPALSASVRPAQSASVGPAQSASVRPAQSASVDPAQSASAGPALSASVRPAQSASVRPAQSAYVCPAQSTSVGPAQSAFVRPAQSASARPAQLASVGPALSASARPALSASVGPVQSASVGPALSASVRPAQSASVRPALSASVGPALSASARPALSASARPALSASEGPALSASVRPAQSASVRPALSASARPAQSASEGPALSASVRPAQSASEGPALSASVRPAQSASEGPALSASVRPAQSASEGPALSASVRPAQSASEGPALSASVRPAQSASEGPALSASVRPAQSAYGNLDQPAARRIDQSASDHPAQSASEDLDQSASEEPGTLDKSAPESIDKSASEELDESASEEPDESASEYLDESASENLDKSAPEYTDQSASGDPDQSASGTLDQSSSVDLDHSAPEDLDQSARGVLDPGGLDQSSSVDLSQSASGALDMSAPGDLDMSATGDLDMSAPGDLDMSAPGDLDMSAPGDLDKSDPRDLDHSASQSDRSVVSESADVCLTLDETTGSLMGICGEDLARPTDQHKSGEVSEGTPHMNETEATKPDKEEGGCRVGDGSSDTKSSDPSAQEKGKVTSVPESPDRRHDAGVSEETQSNTDLQRPRERPSAPKEEQSNGRETSGGKNGEKCEGAGSDGSENGPSGGQKRGIKLPEDKTNGRQREDLPKPEDSSGDTKEDAKKANDDKRRGVQKRGDAVNGDGKEDEQQPGEESSRDAEDTQEVLQPHITESRTRFAADHVEHGETLLATSVHGKRRRQQARSPFHGGQLGPVAGDAGGSEGRESGQDRGVAQADSETHPVVTLGAAWPHAANQTEPPHVHVKRPTNRSARQRKVWHSLKKWTPLGKLASSSDLDRYRSNTLDTIYSLAEFTSNLVLKAADMTIGEAAVDWLDDFMAKGVLVVLSTLLSWMESESFERLMKMISCFLCSTWVGKWVTAVTSYSSLTASRMLAVVDRTYDCLGLSTARGRTRKQTLRNCGLATLLQLLNSTLLYFRDKGLDNVQHSRSKSLFRSAELRRESGGSPRGPKRHGPGSSRGVGGLNLGGHSPGGGSSKTRQGLGGGRNFGGGASGGGLGSGGRRDKDGEEDSVGGGGRRWQSEEGRGSGGRGHGDGRGVAGGRRKTKSDGEDEGERAGRRLSGCTEPGRRRGEGQPDGSGNGRKHGPTDEYRGEDPGGKSQSGNVFQTQAGRQGNGRVGMTAQGVSARGSNPSHENPKHANRQGYDHTTGGYDRFAGRCRQAEGKLDVFDRRGSAGTSSDVETLWQGDLPRHPSQTTAARGASSHRSTGLSQHSHSPDDATRNSRHSPTRPRKGLEEASRLWQEMSSTPYTTNGVHGPPRAGEEDLGGDEDDYHQIDDMTISVLDEVREVTVIPRSKEQRCQETYSRLTSSCPAKGAGGQWPRPFPGRLAATQTRGPGEEEEEEAAGFVGEHVSPAAPHWWTATGRRSDLDISYDVPEDIAERKITPVKRRLGGARKGSGPSPFHLHLPPTMPCSPGFGDLSVGNQFLCLLRKVPLLADIIRDPRDPPPLTYVFDVPTFITDDRMRRLLDLAPTRRAGRDLKRKVSEVYSEEDYKSEEDPDYEPEELDTTDPLEYTEGEAAGVSAEEADVVRRDVTRSVEAEVHREERSWRSCSTDSDKENSRVAHPDLHVSRAPLSTEEMPDATKPIEYTESDAARISGDGTKYVDVKEYDKGNNFREPEAQTETEEQDVDIVEPEK